MDAKFLGFENDEELEQFCLDIEDESQPFPIQGKVHSGRFVTQTGTTCQTVVLPTSLVSEVETVAQAKGITKSEFFRSAISAAVRKAHELNN